MPRKSRETLLRERRDAYSAHASAIHELQYLDELKARSERRAAEAAENLLLADRAWSEFVTASEARREARKAKKLKK